MRGEVRIPDGPPPRTAVVLLHGFLGSKDSGFIPWLADGLAGAGHAVVSATSSGSGVGRSGIRTELERLASSTHTRELGEVGRLVDEVAGGDLVPRRPDRIALLGHGRGGAHALLHAVDDERVATLVTWSAPSSLDRWNAQTRATWRREGRLHVPEPGTGRQLPLGVGLLDDVETAGARLDPVAAAGRLGRPWLLVQGTADLVVEEAEARELARAAPLSRLVLIEGADHAYGAREPFDGPTPALRRALGATLLHLGRDPAGGR